MACQLTGMQRVPRIFTRVDLFALSKSMFFLGFSPEHACLLRSWAERARANASHCSSLQTGASCLLFFNRTVGGEAAIAHRQELIGDILVGAPRFELGTSCAQGRRATRLRYAPTSSALMILKHFPSLLHSNLAARRRRSISTLRQLNTSQPWECSECAVRAPQGHKQNHFFACAGVRRSASAGC